MICFLLTNRNNFTIRNLLYSNRSEFVESITFLNYEQLHKLLTLKVRVLIFSDLDLLTPQQLDKIKVFARQLLSMYPQLIVFNHPDRVLLRKDLLQRLYRAGINGFNVYDAASDWNSPEIKFPVFVREANRHTGSLTKLLYTRDELSIELQVLQCLGYDRSALLIVEFVNNANTAGVFNKYSAFFFDRKVLPRYLTYGNDWVVKSMLSPSDTRMEQVLREIEAYMVKNPHAAWISKVFEESGIEYGRVDYGLVGETLQVWEINLNPAFVRAPKNILKDNSAQRFMREIFYNELAKVVVDINAKYEQVEIKLPTISPIKLTFFEKLSEGFKARLVKQKPHYRIMRSVCYGVARFYVSILQFNRQ